MWLARVGEAVLRLWRQAFSRPGDERRGLTEGTRLTIEEPERPRRTPTEVTDAEYEEIATRVAAAPAVAPMADVRAVAATASAEPTTKPSVDTSRPGGKKQARREAAERAQRAAVEARSRARVEAETAARIEAEARKARAAASARALADGEAKARAEAEAEAEAAEEKSGAEAEAAAQALAEVEARAHAEAEAAEEKARAAAEAAAQALAEVEAKAHAEAEARAHAEAEARAHAEVEAAEEKARADVEAAAQALAEVEAKAHAEAEAAEDKARAEAEAAAQALAEVEAKARAEAEAAEDKARAEAEAAAQALAEVEAKARAEAAAAEEKARAAAEAQALAEAEERTRVEADAKARLEVEAKTKAEAKIKADAEDKARRRAAIEIPKDYVPSAESTNELYQLELDGFEGPLDLLLFLIRRHALDVFDIPIAFICDRYADCLKAMEELNIDVASEFLLMAAELLHIKSKMLLPRPADVEDDEEEIDPRAELVRRLLEYQKFKDAAAQLSGRDRFGRDVFARAPEPLPRPDGPVPLREVGLFALIEAFDAALQRQKPELRHKVMLETASVRQRIRALVESMAERDSMPFAEFLTAVARRIDLVVTFLAILEMTRLRLLRLYQSESGELYLSRRFETREQAYELMQGVDTTLDGPEAGAGQESLTTAPSGDEPDSGAPAAES